MNGVFKAVSKGLGFIIFVAVWALSCSGAGAKSEDSPTPHELVREVTDKMLKVIRNNQKTLEEQPQQFYSDVQAVLDPVVDFRFIAYGVMGSYVKKANPKQRKLFISKFKEGLVSTYAKGMAGFGDRQIVVLPPKGNIGNRKTVSVVQEVKGDDGVNRVSYTMKKNRESEWKLINVVLNGVNLGKVFRGQFAQAMKKKDEDLNAVIEGWSAN